MTGAGHTPVRDGRTLGGSVPAGQTGGVNETPVRVLVVDDRGPFRVAAAAVLARATGFVCVGQATTGEEAVRLAVALRPDLVLMDVRLPGINGVQAAAQVSAEVPGTVVLLCSTYARADLPFPLDAPGVAGYLNKEELRPDALRDLWNAARRA